MKAGALRLALLALLLSAAAAASLLLGGAALSPRSVVHALTAGGGDETARAIVLHLRLPRTATAALVGGALGLSGAVFQSLLRNPLAEPYVLGVSGGAAVGAVAALALSWAATMPAAVPIFAFGGALLAIALVLRIATRAASGLDVRVLLLSGVAVGAFCNALVLLILALGDVETFRSAIFWMMGSFATATWPVAAYVATCLAAAAAFLLPLARPLNLLAVGEETALYLGARVARVKLAAYLAASLLVAASVAAAGAIGFVGLVVPHGVRLAWGSDHRLLLPASLLAGAAFLLLADTAARSLSRPAEMPVGVVTALVGVPLFVALLARGTR